MKKLDYLVAAGLALVAAILYFASLAGYAYPGESARLLCIWQGLETVSATPYPLMSCFARLLGGGNLIAPVCGIALAALMYFNTVRFFRGRMNGENVQRFRIEGSMIAGVAATVVLMLSPAVRSAATHAEPRLFAAVWLLAAIGVFSLRGRWAAVAFPLLWGMGMADSPVFTVLAPAVLCAMWFKHPKHHRKAYAEMGLFVPLSLLAFWLTARSSGDFAATFDALVLGFKAWTNTPGWMWILFFTTIPFFVAIASSTVAFNNEPGWMQWIFHIGMGVTSILAVATPASPSSLMSDAGVLPVLSCVFAAFTAGYLAAYWFILAKARVRINESRDDKPVALKGRVFGIVALGVSAVVYGFTCLFNLFSFESGAGAFADLFAREIVKDLGAREWLVTDGTLDHHLKLVSGGRLNIVSLNRDLDNAYLKELSELVKAKNLGGEKNSELAMSLALGVLPFVQDWFVADPEVTGKVAIFGAPDLWYAAGLKPVPERLFFGGERAGARAGDEVVADLEGLLVALKAPEGWGSYQLRKVKNPLERKRLELRRHLGFVANNRGVYLQDRGRDDEAFAIYEKVLQKIDNDNICALFNLFELSRGGNARAVARRGEYDRRIKAIVEDKSRRYRLWSLSNYYGYIRSPEIFIRNGFAWARSGRPGEALSQISRAIDFIPTDRRSSILNMMAALYASEDDRAKSRRVYENVLAANSRDHDALIGMMRLSLLEGDSEAALGYLEQATAVGGEGRGAQIELAMVSLMKNELDAAKARLKAVVETGGDLRAWSLLAAVTMQQSDATKDEAAKQAFDRELEEEILPQMEKLSDNVNDYYVQTTKAFLMMRKGADGRRAARDAFLVAAKARPDIQATQDIVMSLDISLDDSVAAETHARDTLRRDRKNPLANYVMGSLALRKGNYEEAEAYLKKSADHQRPVVLAMNDLAEVYRRARRYPEAERYARLAIKAEPGLYVAYETLAAVIMDAGGDLAEAELNAAKACELSRVNGRQEDVRMLISLARVQLLGGNRQQARATLRKVESRRGELSAFEIGEYEELKKNAR